MRTKMMTKRLWLFGITAIALIMMTFCVSSEGSFKVISERKRFASYKENRFTAICPEPGLLTISICDEFNTYSVLSNSVTEGNNTVVWDGLSWNGERLLQKYYEVYSVLAGESGTEYHYSYNTYVEAAAQALIFALPSSSTAYTEETEEWFIESRCVLPGNLLIEIRLKENAEDQEQALHVSRAVKSNRINSLTLAEMTGTKALAPGEYTVTCMMEGAGEYSQQFSFTLIEGKRNRITPQVTGEIMPDRDDPDSVIWEKMTAPAAIIDIRAYDHEKVREEQNKKSKNLGTLHGQSQTLKILEIDGEWTRVGAWNHETADYIEGWIPTEKIKVVEPETEYGLLIDKLNQTLTVFRKGERIETLQISTGMATKGSPERETAAGSFLTESHRVDFSTNGLKYDYVMRYDGGNLLHQIPYAWGKGKKDFSPGADNLGQKASHGCIRIQAEPGTQNGINAYWLWTHIPKNTRVIILDDKE